MPPADRKALYKTAMILAYVTVFYNIAEGAVSVWFGLEDETLSLLGFGLDSFAEVISGIGVLHMVLRLGRDCDASRDRFEQRALRITGGAFYLLAAGLTVTAVLNSITGKSPETAFWGIVIGLVSIASMWLLIHHKLRVGRALKSDAILADANCTRVCLYLSIVLLAASLGYELTGIGGIDSIGAVVIAWYALREGRESFQKAKGKSCACEGACGN